MTGTFSIATWMALRVRDDVTSAAGDAAWTGSAQPLPSSLRRRVTPLGQQAMQVAYGIAKDAPARFVFASRHGEFERTLRLLRALAAREPLSPADFSLSVHNALAGLLSIATANTAGHTTIAAGADSFCCGMLEAVACLARDPDEPVLLVYCDAPLPGEYESFSADETVLAVAMLLRSGGTGERFALSLAPGTRAALPAATQHDALAFLDFIASDRGEILLPGARFGWRWRRAA